MKYTYFSVTGIIEEEVDERLYSQLAAMDDEWSNSERRHRRHCPVDLYGCPYEGGWFKDMHDAIGEIETMMDTEALLSSLTELQRTCFEEIRLNGRFQQEIADELGKSRSTVRRAAEGAAEILKNILAQMHGRYTI